MRAHSVRLDNVVVADACGKVQARALVVVARVGRAAAREEQLDLLEISGARELAQLSRGARLVERERGAFLDEPDRDVAVPLPHGVGQRGALPVVEQGELAPRLVIGLAIGLGLGLG